ncbi:MAG TPA: isoprenylcysteine carboxylmethyltransferase family protein [Vicinamibacterales bacterium]|jgi:protein-S-isoprenylcysteine O-methyltransferase Ste14|nr:isoprenylcysteine carboxylmethyltransferase family protein [Vicinamibacterales bacterium]
MVNDDQTFALVLRVGWLTLLPIIAFHRIRSQMTGEKLDRRQEGALILLTLRPAGIAHMVGVVTYMVDPSRMAWSSMPLPLWLRWAGVAVGAASGALLTWTLMNLGKNLTDTVVTRKAHTLVTVGPYRWVRHPFYDAVALAVLANSLVAANWFLLATGALLMTMMVIRTRREEEHLLARFGDAYRSYMNRTGRFVPGRTRS